MVGEEVGEEEEEVGLEKEVVWGIHVGGDVGGRRGRRKEEEVGVGEMVWDGGGGRGGGSGKKRKDRRRGRR